MPDSARKPPKVVPLDGDRLGHIGAATAALIVALTQMFWRDAGPMVTLVRSGWTYVGVYAAVYLLVRLFLRASLFQMLEDKRDRRDERRRMMRERQEAARSGPAPAQAPAADRPGGPLPPSETGLPTL